jgi:hypothetical protein
MNSRYITYDILSKSERTNFMGAGSSNSKITDTHTLTVPTTAALIQGQ